MPHTFETEHFILKQPQLSPKEMLQLPPTPMAMRYVASLVEKKAKSELDKILLVSRKLQKDHKQGFGFYMAVDKKSNKTIGQAGIITVGMNEGVKKIMAGCFVSPEFWGHHYASEILYPLIDLGFKSTSGRALVLTRYYDAQMISYKLHNHDIVHVEEYNPNWPLLAAQEISTLHKLLPSEHIIAIEHIGSTAVPGMMSKPVIDIQIVVDSIDAIHEQAKTILKSPEYTYGKTKDPKWLFFIKGHKKIGQSRSHHVHIVEKGCQRWKNNSYILEYLLNNPERAKEYCELKQKLEVQYRYDRIQYSKAKQKFVEDGVAIVNAEKCATPA